MKFPGFFNRRGLFTALLSIHLIPLIFTLYMGTFLSHILPFLTPLALPIIIWLAYKSKAPRWQTLFQSQTVTTYCLKIAATFLGLLFLLNIVANFSLFVEPVMFNEAGEPVLIKLPGAEMGAYVLRLCVQAWCLAVGVALVMNQLPPTQKTGLMLGRFKWMPAYVWLIDLMVMAGMNIAAFALATFALIQIQHLIAFYMGLDEIIFAQNDIFMMAFFMYLLNISMKFAPRLREFAKESRSSVTNIILIQSGFLLLSWFLTKISIFFLPVSYREELHAPIFIPDIVYEKFIQNWQLFVLGWSFFVIPALAAYLARLSSNQNIRLSVTTLLVIPGLIVCAAMLKFPTLASAFTSMHVSFDFITMPLDNVSARFNPGIGAWGCIAAMALMLFCLRNKSLMTDSMVSVMPDNFGRKRVRMKRMFAQLTAYFYMIYMMTAIMGVFALGLFVSIYTISVVVGLLLILFQGLISTLTQDPTVTAQPMERANI